MLPNLRFQRYSCRKAFTLVELLVIMVVVGVLTAIILPSLNKARLKANAVQCVDQFRELGAVYTKYTSETDAIIPVIDVKNGKNPTWQRTLQSYSDSEGSWSCPGCKQGHHGIGYNHFIGEIGSIDNVRKPSATVAFGDAGIIRNPSQVNPDLWIESKTLKNNGFGSGVFLVPSMKDWEKSSRRMVNRHLGRSSVIFVDGHADSIPASAVGFQYKKGHVRALWDNQ
ncbi:MAG TPA: hypothetical protein DEB48_03470 [Verrucomicrobiales bacterium]|nr:hypothetical protein [Verrucomicrobiales bacterium]